MLENSCRSDEKEKISSSRERDTPKLTCSGRLGPNRGCRCRGSAIFVTP